MTSCPTEEDLVLLVDGALEPAQEEEAAAHLAECADCRALLARSEAALRYALGGMADASAAVPVDSSMSSLGLPAGDALVAPRRRVLTMRRAGAAAAVLTAAAAGWIAASSSGGARTEVAIARGTPTPATDPASQLRALAAEAARLSADPPENDVVAITALAAAEARVALDLPTATARLRDVIDRFPGTPEAREARARLASLGEPR